MKASSIKRFFILGSLALLIFGLTSSIGVSIWLYMLSLDLPDTLNALHEPQYTLPTVLYDRHGNQVDEFFLQRRIVIDYDEMPEQLIQALIASEDSRFFYHFGIDPIRMLKAFLINLKAQRFEQGASTITQQTARQFLLTREKKLIRKLKEILLSIRIEQQFSKKEILTLYLNKVFFGNAEGVEASAQDYFGKHAKDLSLSESALLVGVLPAPSAYSPRVNKKRARQKRNQVLMRMYKEGFITLEEKEAASQEEIRLSKANDTTSDATAYYVEHVRKYLIQKYGSDQLYKGGLQVHLAMDLDYQTYAHDALQKGILDLDKRQGYRGALKQVTWPPKEELSAKEKKKYFSRGPLTLGEVAKGVVTQITKKHAVVLLGDQEGILEWSLLKSWHYRIHQNGKKSKKTRIRQIKDAVAVGDVILVRLEEADHVKGKLYLSLYQEPQVNGAILSIVPQTGHVVAMSGGYSFKQNQFNRAIQAKRQPGSAFKPMVFAAALDSGYTLSSPLVDSPRYYKNKVLIPVDNAETEETEVIEEESIWIPKNYGNKLLGEVSLKYALVKSLNLPTIGLVEDLGPRHIINYARSLGLNASMEKNLTIGLGSFSVTLENMLSAFSAFPNEGKTTQPIYILKVESSDGELLEFNATQYQDAISPQTAFLITQAMEEVVEHGTGRIARKIGRPSAGKTGTTNKNVDAWYVGYIPQLLTGVYVGFDRPKPMGRRETGAGAAAPIWVEYMKNATANLPILSFKVPSQIVQVRLHESGRRALSCDPISKTYQEYFLSGTEPAIPQNAEAFCKRTSFPTQNTRPQVSLDTIEF